MDKDKRIKELEEKVKELDEQNSYLKTKLVFHGIMPRWYESDKFNYQKEFIYLVLIGLHCNNSFYMDGWPEYYPMNSEVCSSKLARRFHKTDERIREKHARKVIDEAKVEIADIEDIARIQFWDIHKRYLKLERLEILHKHAHEYKMQAAERWIINIIELRF